MTVLDDTDPTDPAHLVEETRVHGSTYTSQAVFDREMDKLFSQGWVYVAHESEIADPGDYVTRNMGREPVIVSRAKDGSVHVLTNRCTHRGNKICTAAAGNTSSHQCPYHGWTYDLDGRLMSAPRMAGVATFNREKMGLLRRHAATWGPLLFLYMGGDPPNLDAVMAPLDERLGPTLWSGLTWAGGEDHVVESNWKVYVDNYLDGGYHVATLHKRLTDDLDMDTYTTETLDTASIQRVGGAPDATRIGEGAQYAWVYPNLMVNRYGPVLDVNIVVPERCDRTTVRFDYWFEETEGAEAQRFMAESRAKSREVQEEDAAICLAVQRGLASIGYDTGRYAPQVEVGEHHFHRLLARDYRAAIAED